MTLLLRVAFVLVVLQALPVCAASRDFEWTEDVRFADGTTGVVKRSVRYEGFVDFSGGREATWVQTESRLTLPMEQEKHGVPFIATLTPLVLDLMPNKVLYVVCIAGSGKALNEWKVTPKEPYVAFTLRNGAWERISLSEVPVDVRVNLLVSTRTLFFEKGGRNGMHVSQQIKDELDSNPLIGRRFKSIVR